MHNVVIIIKVYGVPDSARVAFLTLYKRIIICISHKMGVRVCVGG